MFRYERKFKIPETYYFQIKNKIEINGWFQHYPDRVVNNIYLDDLSHTAYSDSIDGHLDKRKYRIRWYGNLFSNYENEPPQKKLEIKIKRDSLNYKKIYEVENFDIKKALSYSSLNKKVNLAMKNLTDIKNTENIYNMEPQFINQYKREYYIDMRNEIRLTIDRNLNFYNIRPIIHKADKFSDIILELKFSSLNSYKNFMLKSNLVQISKFSLGVERVYI